MTVGGMPPPSLRQFLFVLLLLAGVIGVCSELVGRYGHPILEAAVEAIRARGDI